MVGKINAEELRKLVGVAPMGDRVLVLHDTEETQTAGGILLASPGEVSKNTGTVLAVGDFEGIRVKPGQRVVFERGMGSPFKKAYEATNPAGLVYTAHLELALVPYFDVIAILEDDRCPCVACKCK